MVTHVYKEAIELYDRHIYEKGACVYHMLHHQLGDELFAEAIRTFVNDNAHQTVETIDLMRAANKATGLNVQPLFDQYVFRGGHPDYKLSYSWDSEAKLAKLTVNQTQDKDYLFDLKLPIAFGYDKGRTLKRFDVRVSEAEQSFYFPLPEKPQFISFDCGNHHLKTVELTYPLPELKAQLLYDPDVISRIEAAQAITKKGGLEALKALQTSLAEEKFWGVRVEVCNAIADIALDQALEVLVAALHDESPYVRKAAIASLAKHKTKPVFDALVPFLQAGDPSYYVEAVAASAIGEIAGKTVDAAVDPTAAIALLQEVLDTKAGWNEVVRSGAIAGLAQLKDSEPALDLILQYTAKGVPQPLRLAAIRSLGTYAAEKENSKVLERLRELSRETFFLTQVAVVIALGQLNTPKAIAILQSLDTQDGRVSRAIAEAVEKVQANAGSDKAVKEMRDELEQLKKTNQELLSRLAALEAKTSESTATTTPAPEEEEPAPAKSRSGNRRSAKS
jgi:aminopeptidase N